jgi:hypothetical protein
VVREEDAGKDDDSDTIMLGNFMATPASHSIVVLNWRLGRSCTSNVIDRCSCCFFLTMVLLLDLLNETCYCDFIRCL